MGSTSDRTYEDGLLRARAEDAVRLSNMRGAPCFLPFLDERQQALVRPILRRLGGEQVCFFGGYADSERAMVGCFPPEYPPDESWFPITALAFRYREQTGLTHRDFLGTLMACGIKRDKIGDILCGTGLSVVFVDEEIAPFLCEQIDRVGGEGVTIERDYVGELPVSRQYRPIRATIASARLDGIVKALIAVSRETAADKIRLGAVLINHVVCNDVSARVAAGDCISIAGSGRFWVDAVDQPTKKGRLVLEARQCI